MLPHKVRTIAIQPASKHSGNAFLALGTDGLEATRKRTGALHIGLRRQAPYNNILASLTIETVVELIVLTTGDGEIHNIATINEVALGVNHSTVEVPVRLRGPRDV
jgi:hypothetical protein